MEQAVVRGSELLKQGKIDQAQRAFRAALELDPDNPRVLALLGLSHFRANELAEARPIYEQLVERSPSDASHRLNLGLVYLKLNDADKAIDALEASRVLDPSQGRAVSYLGLAYARAGRYTEAYHAFLVAGQNDLAIEIESNMAAAERDRIHAQLGRSPQGLLGAVDVPQPAGPALTVSRAAAPVSAGRLLTSAQLMQPTQPMPTMPSTQMPAMQSALPTQPMPAMPAMPAMPTTPATPAMQVTQPMPAAQPMPATQPMPAMTGDAARNAASRRVPLPAGVPRTKPPSAPPGKARTSEAASDLEASASPEPAMPGAPLSPAALRANALSREPVRITDSMQFVIPRAEPAAPVTDGSSMISRAVASATPSAIPVGRTRSGGLPPRPLSELATDDLVRPDEADDAFEISANGSLIIRITDRVLTRLDGVHITGGDLSYELATRRSRGHNTETAFDYGGSQLHVVTGRGYLIAIADKHAFNAVSLDDDILYLREDLVFAFQASLRWENGNVPGLRGKLPVVQFRGNGALVLRLVRPLVRVKLPAQGVVFIDAERLAGWIGRVIPRAVVPPPGGPLGTMCVECTGEGVVLVEPAPGDLLAAPWVAAKPPLAITAAPAAPAPHRPENRTVDRTVDRTADLAADLELIDHLDGL